MPKTRPTPLFHLLRVWSRNTLARSALARGTRAHGAPSSGTRALAAGAALGLACTLAWQLPATAQDAPSGSAAQLYKEADLVQGAKLLREHRCAECHTRKVGGDGSAIYRPAGRINSPAALRGMVEQCNLELNLALFPDEVTSISAVLNRDHYRFK